MTCRQPLEEFMIEQLDPLLHLSTLDGTEAHGILERLASAVRDADDDPLLIHDALSNAKQRMRALIADTVPREAVNNAVSTCIISTEANMTPTVSHAPTFSDKLNNIHDRIRDLLAQIDNLRIERSNITYDLYVLENELEELQTRRSLLACELADLKNNSADAAA